MSNETSSLALAQEALREAASNLLADVRRRYPGEELRCPHMIALDAALTALPGAPAPAAEAARIEAGRAVIEAAKAFVTEYLKHPMQADIVKAKDDLMAAVARLTAPCAGGK